jgi:hypothetical protein
MEYSQIKKRRMNNEDFNQNDCFNCDLECVENSKLTCQGCRVFMHKACFGLKKGEWLRLFEKTIKKGELIPFSILCHACLQDIKILKDNANNLVSGGLNPFLIDNVSQIV